MRIDKRKYQLGVTGALTINHIKTPSHTGLTDLQKVKCLIDLVSKFPSAAAA